MISKGRPAPKDRLKTHLEIERIDFPKNGDSENETPFTNGKFGYPYEMVNFKCAYYIIYIYRYMFPLLRLRFNAKNIADFVCCFGCHWPSGLLKN